MNGVVVRKFLWLGLAACLSGILGAQTLEQVLSSVQERKLAVEQRDRIASELAGAADPGLQLISWSGLPGGGAFPADGATAQLSVSARISLLNQALGEFAEIAPSYLNLRQNDLLQGAKIGALRPYMKEDFEVLPRVDAENFPIVLAGFARQVERLRILPWVSKVGTKTKQYNGYRATYLDEDGRARVDPISDPIAARPSILDDGELTGGGPSWAVVDSRSHSSIVNESLSAWGSYTLFKNEPGQDDTETTYCGQSTTYFSKASAFVIPAGSQSGLPSLSGKVAFAARNRPTNVASDSFAEQLPVEWDPSDAAFHVLVVSAEISATGGVEISVPNDDPGIVAKLDWPTLQQAPDGTSWSSGDLKRARPAGAWGSPGANLSREIYPLFLPAFSRGLNGSPAISEALLKAGLAERPPSGDGKPVLWPAPGLLMGIPLGVGLDGDGATGWIAISPGCYEFWNSDPHSLDNFAFGTIAPGFNSVAGYLTKDLAIRFDHSSNLRFAGAAQDFHVVYATARNAVARGEALPDSHPQSAELDRSGWEDQSALTAWDLPRLRQVVGRDLLADIQVKGHYHTEVKIYRRVGTSSVERTPGKIVDIDASNFSLVRTIVIKNPNHPGGYFPDGPEVVEVSDDGSGTYRVERGSLAQNTGTLKFVSPSSESTFTLAVNAPAPGGLGATVVSTLDGHSLGTTTISRGNTAWRWWDRVLPEKIEYNPGLAGETRTHKFTTGGIGSRRNTFAKSIELTIGGGEEPESSITWTDEGRLEKMKSGPWLTKVEPDDQDGTNGLKATHSLNTATAVYTTTRTKWEDGGRKIETRSASDGSAQAVVSSSKIEYGNTSGTGLPGLPHRLINADDTETHWDWVISGEGEVELATSSGRLAGGQIANGSKRVEKINARGYAIGWEQFFLQDGALSIGGASVPDGTEVYTGWKAPLKFKDDTTKREVSCGYDGMFERLASFKDALGNQTSFSGYDASGRLTDYSWGQANGSIEYNEGNLGTKTSLALPGRTLKSTSEWDVLGRTTFGKSEVSGVASHQFTLGYDASDNKTLVASDSVTQASTTAKFRGTDGSFDEQVGSLPFGGLEGSAIEVEGGLFKTTRNFKDSGASSTFATTWADAWGRVRKVRTAGANGGTDDTLYEYSEPSSQLKKVIAKEASGRWLITESEPWASGGITVRSGVDLGNDGSLGATDRFTKTVTGVSGSKLKTTVTVNGIAGSLVESEYDPTDGTSSTAFNGNEEKVEETPNFSANKTKVEHKRGTSTVSLTEVTLNNLGEVDYAKVSGAGIPETLFDPTYRADGSLNKLESSVGGRNAGFVLNGNGTLNQITHPVLGDLNVTHEFDGDWEKVVVNGVTAKQKLDGTESSLSGATVMGYESDKVVASAGSYQRTIKPHEGETTTTVANAAGMPTSHNYISGPGRTMTWNPGGLPNTVSLARGGNLAFGYSGDGAKDLTSVSWPQTSSGPLTASGGTVTYEYNTAGLVNAVTDASGRRSLGYNKGRLTSSEWTSGPLSGYRVERGLTNDGRLNTVKVFKGTSTTPLHDFGYAYTGVGEEILGMNSGAFSATMVRRNQGDTVDRADRALMKIVRGGVEQYWKRGQGGRVVEAGSNVTGAPGFDYVPGNAQEANCFDAWGRRLKCATGGGTWTYNYGVAGQLQSAVHSGSQGSFNYSFDGIGRRNGGSDLLNQFKSAVHTVAPKLQISAHPDAELFVNGAPQDMVNGRYTHVFAPPGAAGVWAPWDVLVVRPLPSNEQEPGANPNAKAESSGAVWIPPATENFTYDLDGNRLSSSQWSYAWDALNRLVRARTKDYTTAPEGWDLGFSYDSEGRRIKKTVTHKTRAAGGQAVTLYKEILFVWDGWDLLYERHQDLHGNALLERKYVWGPDIGGEPFSAGGAGGLLLMRESGRGAAPADYYPLYDGSGHVTGLANSAGTLVATYAYGPFGERISASGAMSNSNPWRYATKYLDEETGLYYFGHRYYDPASGQWLSREPLGESESVNLYSYCHNDPVNGVDRLGLDMVNLKGKPLLRPQEGHPGYFDLLFPIIGPGEEGQMGWYQKGLYRYGVVSKGTVEKLRSDPAYLKEVRWRAWQNMSSGEDVQANFEASAEIEGAISTIPGGMSAISIADGNYAAAAGHFVEDVGYESAKIYIGGKVFEVAGVGVAKGIGALASRDSSGLITSALQTASKPLAKIAEVGNRPIFGSGGRGAANAVEVGAGLESEVVASEGVNPALATRLEAFKRWKASKGYDAVTSAQFRRFMGAHRPNSAGATLYPRRFGFADWSRAIESVHGNTAGSQLAWLYRLETSSGKFLKWGVTANPATRYPENFMEGKRLIPIKQGPRSIILEIERRLTENYPGPLNFEPWAGSNNLFWEAVGR